MNILQCYAGNLYGGIERQLTMFARLNISENHLGKWFALCFPGRLSTELAEANSTVFWMGPAKLSRPWSVWAARKRLKKVLEDNSFDAVICHAMWPHLVFGPVVRKANVPLVVWAHDTPIQLHWIDRIGMRIKPDLVIANSAYTKEYWQKNYPDVPCKVGYYPLPEPEHEAVPIVRTRLRKEIGAGEKTTVILIASRFEEWKGHRVLFKALHALKGRQDWQCWIAGGAQRDHEKKMIATLKASALNDQISDRIRWLGSRSDVFDLMLASDIYCQPNLAPEPFGVVFLEAMHAKLAIVTANKGGPREFLDNDTGMMIDEVNATQLTEQLSILLDNPERRLELGRAAKSRVEQMFNLNTNVKCLNEIFSSLISNDPRKKDR